MVTCVTMMMGGDLILLTLEQRSSWSLSYHCLRSLSIREKVSHVRCYRKHKSLLELSHQHLATTWDSLIMKSWSSGIFCQCYSAPAVLIKFILIRYIIPGTLGLFWLVAMWCSNRYEWSRSGQSSQLLKEKYWFVVLDYCPHGLLVKQVKNQLCFWNINILFDHSELFFLSCFKVQIPQSYVLTLLLTKSKFNIRKEIEIRTFSWPIFITRYSLHQFYINHQNVGQRKNMFIYFLQSKLSFHWMRCLGQNVN